MKKFCIIILLLILNPGIYAQWVKTDFNDANVLLCTDFNGSNGVLGGWHEFIGNAYYTSDQGSTWQTALTPDSLRVIVDLQIMNDSLIYGCGAKNKIMSSGNSPVKYDELFRDRLKYYLFKQGILPGYNHELYKGQFLESTDRGHSWHYKGSLSDSVAYLIDLKFLSLNNGFVLANNDSSTGLLRTTDGGNNWNWSYLAGPGVALYAFDFLDSLNGFITGAHPAGGLIVKTTDGGATWSEMVMNGFLEISKIKSIPPSTTVVSAFDIYLGQNIFISSDNGAEWSLVYSHPNMLIDGINGLPGGWIIFYGTYYPTGSSTPFVNGTTNMGESWVESTLSPLTNIIMAGSKMVDNNNWYITGTDMLNYGFLLHTSNSGGLPVELISFTASQAERNIKLQWFTASETNNMGFEIQRKTLQSEFRTIGFVKGKGTTTEKQSYLFTDQPDGISDKIIYRLKQVDFNGSFTYSDEISINPITPFEFALNQNYPNPFNPATSIEYSIPYKVTVVLKVFDVLGNEVTTLVNEEKPEGKYKIKFDGNNLSAGVYFYQLWAGNYTTAKKLILMK